ncbi:putative ATPase/DNA-binding winged helix-turn-helix (wHTH) protein [Bosea sp. BE125]|uniref:winged helix-turn-helix domain-containing protein n=1 Tax=Bosea sp. BE125 TaxID=2817909 RepID=UPI002856FC88|nr:winged helix-turn-helix domain-containing protein [Bosea sp. BE125]MDR6873180.1 putative ATPase/DNA-binding winged helix-turn-helix (wHTH) protein [Bosea sp. BE125]
MTRIDRSEEVLSFGSFELMPSRRILLESGKPVGIRSRALDILCLLVDASGQILSKDDLLARAWPSTFVAEANVRVQINELRRVLGDGRHGRRYIATVPNRGYSFVETVRRRPVAPPGNPAIAADRAGAGSPPAWPGRIIGRDRSIQALVKQVRQRRLVTVVGTGGVGKTTLVLSLIAQMRQDGEKPAWQKIVFVDLASLSDGQAVPSAFASALGVVLAGDDALSSIVNYLGEEACLLVIDNCEHVIDPVVDIVEAILCHAPNVFLLATSREPLRVADEWVYRLQPLAAPPVAATLSLDEALAYPAATLFVERVCARCGSMALRDDDGRFVADICRRLDGIPLALELAAGRFEAFGARGLAAVLDNLFAVLTRGERKALPRQQTLHATLDWSFNLLTTRDQTLLRRLAVFSNRFTLASASAIAAWGELSTTDVTEGIADLVSQSLISTAPAEEEPSFILLETTRAYAREKLAAAPCATEVAKRHARWCLDLLAETERPADPARAADELGLLADLRAALNWAFSPHGDAKSGVSLTVAAIPLWLRLSMVSECRERVEEALARHGDEDDSDDEIVLKLQTARGWALMYNAGTARQTSDVWKAAHGLAERLDDNDYRLRSLWGLWAGNMKSAAFETALESAFQFKSAAEHSLDSDDLAIGDRLIGTSLHFLGDQEGARHHIEQMLDRYPAPGHRSHIARYQVAPRIAALMTLSRVLWLQGYLGAAADMAAASIAEARSLDHHLSLCYALAQSACPIALLNGDLEQAERMIDELVEETTRHRLEVWHIYAQAYRGHLHSLQREPDDGLPLMQRAVDELRSARFMQHHSGFVLALVEALISVGQSDSAHVLLDEQLAYLERDSRLWVAPEILRLKGELALRLGEQTSGEALLDQSLILAKQTGQLGWHIRSCLRSSKSRDDRLREIQKIVPRSLLSHFDAEIANA